MDDTLAIIEFLSNKVKHGMDVLSTSDKYLETMDEVLLDKVSFQLYLKKFLKRNRSHKILFFF